MMTRILVAVIAIPLLVLLILFAPLWAMGIVVGGIAACSAWEMLACVETGAPRRFSVYAAAAAFVIPLGTALAPDGMALRAAGFLLFALMFCELMLSFRRETTMALETVTTVLLAGAVMPALLAAIVRLGAREWGSVYMLLPFVAAFSTDSGAYFVGLSLGRHKLAPRLSPHKTIEGSAGGILCAIALMLVYGLILKAAGFAVDFPVLGAYGFLGALACELGDLGFSAVKRLCGVKDYGKLIPGHGGMLDRFDGMFWTAAMLELLVAWVPAITKTI